MQWINGFLNRWLLPLIPTWVTPNMITVGRMVGTVCVFLLVWQEQMAAALLMFVFSAVTDYLDGWLAREREQFSDWGKRWDERTDKLLVYTLLFELLVLGYVPEWLIEPLWIMVLLSALREVVVTLGRKFGWVKYCGVLRTAKIKATLQMIAIASFLLSLSVPFEETPFITGALIFFAATCCAVWSGVAYFRRSDAAPVPAE